MLKSCPFCGKDIVCPESDFMHPNGIAWFEHEEGYRHYNYVRLNEVPYEQWCWEISCVQQHGGCGANISGDTREDVISNWNRRV